MKKILTLIVCAAALLSCGRTQQPTPIKVISYNIRMSAAPDADGDNRWENRKQASVNMMNDQQPTLLGLQEACPDQVAFLDESLPLRNKGCKSSICEICTLFHTQEL